MTSRRPRPEAVAHVVHRYVNFLSGRAKREYARAYVAWVQNGAIGVEPEYACSLDAAQAVRQQIDKLTHNPGGKK